MWGIALVLLISESKLSIFLLPAAFIFFYSVNKNRVKNIFKMTIIIPVISVLFITSYDFIQKDNLFDYIYTSPEKAILWFAGMHKIDSDYSFDDIERLSNQEGRYHTYLMRGATVYYATKMLQDNPEKLMLGYGPGELRESFFHKGSLSTKGFYRHAYAYIVLELGFIGIFSWLLLFLYILKSGYRAINVYNKGNFHSLWKPILYFVNTLNITMVIGFFYNTSFLNYYIGYVFWISNAFSFWFLLNSNKILISQSYELKLK